MIGRVLAERLLDPRHLIAWRVGRHEEGGNAFAASVRVGRGENEREVGTFARGDELLGAVNHEAVAALTRLSRDRCRVGARVGLGKAEATEPAVYGPCHDFFQLADSRPSPIDTPPASQQT
jgi:hypothetical protein